MSLVFGEEDVQFLRDRHEAMTQNPLFSDMEYSEDHTLLTERFPLMMK
jgi:malate dehydrogenase (quinone)